MIIIVVMKKYFNLILALYFAIFIQHSAIALDLRFPQRNPYTTRANVTYILGCVNKGSELTINGEKVEVRKNGAFCYIVNLIGGENKFVLNETNGEFTDSKTVVINKPVPQPVQNQSPAKKYVPPQKEVFSELQYSTVVTDGAPVRNKPSTSGDRISHLPIDTVLLLEAKLGDWYKICTGNSENLWIYAKNVNVSYPVNNRIKVVVREAVTCQDELFEFLKLKTDIPVLFKTKEIGNNIELTLYGIKDYSLLENVLNCRKDFEQILVKSYENDNLTLEFPSSDRLWGYNADYKDGYFIFKKRKSPVVSSSLPLKNVVIAVDAGHGGKELGTIGPTRIPEKDVNLAISKYLKCELEKRGAVVVMTREEDNFVGLYERPDIANASNAIISISIHSNSMVDGNPFIKHGTSVFYYNAHAKNLAETIKVSLVNDLGLKDDGTRYGNFVLTRPTMPVSVLVEVAYMPNLDEYELLTDENFQRKVAASVAKSLEKYMKENAKLTDY